LVLLFSSIALLAGWDVLSDLQEGTTLGHVAIEIGVFTVAMLGALWTLQRLRTLRSESQELRMEAAQLQARLSSAQADARHFQNEVQGHVRGLSQAIDNQFEAWGLTQAEKQVALLPLKGLSHKEIGAVRGVSEATVRQQSRAVYKKGNLSGRHDLAAFFLEDLLAPSQRSDTA
jgi:DNA-binding CsgD family transcriptional regulator